MGMSDLTKTTEEFDDYAKELGVIELVAEYAGARVFVFPSGLVELWEPSRSAAVWKRTSKCSVSQAQQLS